MKKKGLALCLTLLLVLSLGLLLLPVHGEEDIYDNVVRLHVLANSDSEEDQALKLKVRDAILEESALWFADCRTQEEALSILLERTDDLEQIARNTLQEEGCHAPVTVLLGEEEYPRRTYDGICFPGGSYTSLRVCIGEAEGQNWWCCLFPPLCKDSSVTDEDAEDAFIQVGFTPDQYKVITESEKPIYRVRFKLLELLQDLF